MKFKVGDKVKIIRNYVDSINHIGDVGIINEIDEVIEDYRVYVEGRESCGKENTANWQHEDDLELIIEI